MDLFLIFIFLSVFLLVFLLCVLCVISILFINMQKDLKIDFYRNKTLFNNEKIKFMRIKQKYYEINTQSKKKGFFTKS